MRFFNTAGPVNCRDHYCLPPLERFDLADVLTLIDQEKVLRAARAPTDGRLTCLLALMAQLNREHRYRCLYVNFEVAQGYRERINEGMAALLRGDSGQARLRCGDTTVDVIARDLITLGAPSLSDFLGRRCSATVEPTVLLIDEIDALGGRSAHHRAAPVARRLCSRPGVSRQRVILCGVPRCARLSDPFHSEQTIITGGSAFNIKATSLRLGHFIRTKWRLCSPSIPPRPANLSSRTRSKPPGS